MIILHLPVTLRSVLKGTAPPLRVVWEKEKVKKEEKREREKKGGREERRKEGE